MLSVTLCSGDIVFPQGRRLRIRLDPAEPVATSGTIVILHGDNGSGKSTILKAISGVFRCFADDDRRPAASQMAHWSVGGVPTEVTPRATKNVLTNGTIRGGYLAQSVRSNVFCRTIEDELAFSLEHSGLEPFETRARLGTSIAEMASLGIDTEKAPHALSKGQQQVLGIKSLVQPDPDVLFLDEPSAALDTCAVEWLVNKLLSLIREGRLKMVFLATQDTRLLTLFTPKPEVQLVRVDGEVTEDPPWAFPDLKEDGHIPGHSLEMRDITSSWGTFEVELPSITLSPGQALILAGRNGSGKSTLLETIAGFKRAKAGEIRFAETVIRAGRRACSQIINYAFQDAEEQVTFHRAERELLYPRKLNGWRKNVETLISRNNINLAVSPWHLSFGQRKLLTYYALVFSSPILAVDEPFASLDAMHRAEVAGILACYLSAGGIVVATASGEHEEFNRLPSVSKLQLGR